MKMLRSLGLALGLLAINASAPVIDRPAAEQHVVRERKAVKKSRKQRMKELQRAAFEGK